MPCTLLGDFYILDNLYTFLQQPWNSSSLSAKFILRKAGKAGTSPPWLYLPKQWLCQPSPHLGCFSVWRTSLTHEFGERTPSRSAEHAEHFPSTSFWASRHSDVRLFTTLSWDCSPAWGLWLVYLRAEALENPCGYYSSAPFLINFISNKSDDLFPSSVLFLDWSWDWERRRWVFMPQPLTNPTACCPTLRCEGPSWCPISGSGCRFLTRWEHWGFKPTLSIDSIPEKPDGVWLNRPDHPLWFPNISSSLCIPESGQVWGNLPSSSVKTTLKSAQRMSVCVCDCVYVHTCGGLRQGSCLPFPGHLSRCLTLSSQNGKTISHCSLQRCHLVC